MRRYVLARVGRAVLTVWCIVSLVFLLTRLSGDPSEWLLPDDAPEEVREQFRSNLGLDLPLHVQYVRYFQALLTGDVGVSYAYQRPVADLFLERAADTLSLGLIAFFLAIVVGVPMGVIAALKRNSAIDRLSMAAAVGGHTIPNFVQGILLIFLFSLILGLLPSGGTGTPAHFVLPVFTLAASGLSSIARLTRSSMLDVLRQDYLDTARAKGVPERVVTIKHGLRNALISVVTIIGLQLGTLIGGTVVVETVFAWPGIGQLVVNATRVRDFPVIQFGVMIVAATVVLANLLVDLIYGVLDPRIRLGARA